MEKISENISKTLPNVFSGTEKKMTINDYAKPNLVNQCLLLPLLLLSSGDVSFHLPHDLTILHKTNFHFLSLHRLRNCTKTVTILKQKPKLIFTSWASLYSATTPGSTVSNASASISSSANITCCEMRLEDEESIICG